MADEQVIMGDFIKSIGWIKGRLRMKGELGKNNMSRDLTARGSSEERVAGDADRSEVEE